MKRVFMYLVAAIIAAGLAAAACAPAAAPPTPTKAPAAPAKPAEPTKASAPAPTKAAEPTKALAAQPTAAPAKKVDFPQKGRAITIIVPYPAGSATDLANRLLGAFVEKDLGTPVEIANKPGAGAQVGITELVKSRPDGYTLGATNLPTVPSLYLDPERKAVFGRKDFQPLMRQVIDPNSVYVNANGPYKTLKDLVDAAKAGPEKVKIATAGIKSDTHIAGLLLQKAAGVKFGYVHATGAEALTMVLGNQVDAATLTASAYPLQVKSGELRLLAVMDQQRSRFYPDAATAEQLGYKVYAGSARGLAAPGGTAREVIDILGASFKKAVDGTDVKAKMEGMYLEQKFMDAVQFSAFWDEQEIQVKALLAELETK